MKKYNKFELFCSENKSKYILPHPRKNITLAISALLILVFFPLPIYAVHETPSIEFQSGGGQTLADGFVDPFIDTVPVIITVRDDSYKNNGEINTITIQIKSDTDQIGIPLVLSEEDENIANLGSSADSGIFRNKNLLFASRDNQFELSDTAEIIFTFDPNANSPDLPPPPEGILTIFAFSTSAKTIGDPGITMDLLETGVHTGIFTGTITFTSDASSGNSLHAEAGDTLSVFELYYGSQVFNALILPNSDPGVGAIKTDVGKSIMAIYEKDSSTFIAPGGINPRDGVPGGSGGGLVINRVVLNFLGGTSGGDFAPPLLTIPKLNLLSLPLVGDMLDMILNADPFTTITALDDPSIDYPVSINGNGYLLTQFANTIETYTGKTGEPVSFKMTLFDATGIEHIALYTNLRGDAREIEDSDTFVIYDEDKPLEITDPHGFFSNVNFTESEYDGKYIANFNMTFAKPMDTSDIIIRTWDELLNSGDIKVLDAIKIEGEPIVNPDTNNLIVPDSTEIVIPYYKLPFYEIPEADSEGNLVYYNSFGGLEEKHVHPYYSPIIYSDEIGRKDRHDDGFQDSIINEETKAHDIVKSLIKEPFKVIEDKPQHVKFLYPSKVGKLDREDTVELNNALTSEYLKATLRLSKQYIKNF